MQVSCKNNDTGSVLRAARLRSTSARQRVLRALVATGRPMTHQQMAALTDLEAMDKVTLYRTLATLRRAALVHVVRGSEGSVHYCANCHGEACPGGHPHFQCLACGQMRCVLGQGMPYLALDEPVVVKAKQFVAFGLCAACAKKNTRDTKRRGERWREVVR